jgi:ubiquinone/menaquinone biosynthesis C-methylase UbiE
MASEKFLLNKSIAQSIFLYKSLVMFPIPPFCLFIWFTEYIRFIDFKYVFEIHSQSDKFDKMSNSKPDKQVSINKKNMSKDNFAFWREVWRKYPETEIVYSTEKGQMRERFYADLLPQKNGLMLDLGCGDGKMRPYIANYVGLDVSSEALKKVKGDVVLGSAEVLPFRDEAFDHVLMCEVFEHIVDRAKCLKEVRRVLRVNGELIISCPYGHHPSHESSSEPLKSYGLPVFSYKNGRFDEEYMCKLLEKFEFKVKEYCILYVKNVANNLIVIGEKKA